MTAVFAAPVFAGWEWAAAGVAVFLAAAVRGFAGFGFSALTVASLSLLAAPAMVVPMVFAMEIAASCWMLPSVWRRADFRWVALVFCGIAVGSPLGLTLLSRLPADVLRSALYGALLCVSVLALFQQRGRLRRWRAPAPVVGLLAGVGNGMAAIAGAISVLFLLAERENDPARIRASLVCLFLATDIYALCWGGAMGVAGAAHFWTALLLLPALFAGVTIGGRFFQRSTPEKYRLFALGLIFAVAAGGLLRQLAGVFT